MALFRQSPAERMLRDAERWDRMSVKRRLLATLMDPRGADRMARASETVAALRAAERPEFDAFRLSSWLKLGKRGW